MEDGGWETVYGGSNTEMEVWWKMGDERQRLEEGRWKLKVGRWRLEVGRCKVDGWCVCLCLSCLWCLLTGARLSGVDVVSSDSEHHSVSRTQRQAQVLCCSGHCDHSWQSITFIWSDIYRILMWLIKAWRRLQYKNEFKGKTMLWDQTINKDSNWSLVILFHGPISIKPQN